MIALPPIHACMMGYCLAHPYALLWLAALLVLLVPVIRMNTVTFKSKQEKEDYLHEKRVLRIAFTILRSLVLVLILLAIASPFITTNEIVHGYPSLTVLVDNSTSFSVFDKAPVDSLVAQLNEHIPLRVHTIGSGEHSALGDGILNSMQGDDNLLVISDGQNTEGRVLGDVVLFAAKLNTTISTVSLTPKAGDLAVSIKGPREVILGQENEFLVEVALAGNTGAYTLEVEIDGEKVVSERDVSAKAITRAFASGYHRITARLITDDFFEENNIYYKSVYALPKPKLAFVTEGGSPLSSELDAVYDVTTMGSVPQNPDSFSAVVLNNLPGTSLQEHTQRLSEYVADGNGLVFIGGDASFDRGLYQKADYGIEPLLPVIVGKAESDSQNVVNIVLLIDISGTSGQSFSSGSTSSKLDVAKALAIKILSDLRPDDAVAVVAFNDVSYLISPLTPLGEKDNIVERIKTLQADGGTLTFQGLRRADFLLEGANGNKNVILISDGLDASMDTALSVGSSLSAKGVKIYTVGVGFDTHEEFMKSLARRGNGIYFKPDETQHLKIAFGRAEEEPGTTMSAILLDRNHWITSSDIELSAGVTGVNYVAPKLGSQVLAATSQADPLLTVGRYGLGRVVALSTDDGSAWGNTLYAPQNSKLVVRTFNWAIGDPVRTLEHAVSVADVHLGEPATVEVFSDEKPIATDSSLIFSRVGSRAYHASYMPGGTGFFEVMGATFAVNYNKEYATVGMSEEFASLVTLTRGAVFEPADVEGIVEKITELSRRVKIKLSFLRFPFIIAALALFLLEIAIRRLAVNQYMRRSV
ncbi:TPA: VWA domain-containing protein [Candidatus Woesearchaeota archaeon]|nr:VWA domain-containing protein [Candidatus Woesearchaeota archaeon]